jgi:ribosomal-protein-alanine N-acetyltransferase
MTAAADSAGMRPAVEPAAGVRLERMRWWHIEQLLPIEADLFDAEQWSAAMFWSELADGCHYIVAVEDGRVVGYAGLAVASPGEAWVQNVGVRRDAQRRGIGRALVEVLLTEAHQRGATKVLLEVAVDNAPAQRLYASYGFEVVGVRRGYYQPSNTDALVMLRAEDGSA